MTRRNGERIPPAWNGARAGPRVLIEAPDGADGWACRQILEREGYEVAVCPGPDDVACPELAGRTCPAAREADVVVSLLNLGHEQSRLLVGALANARQASSIVIEVTPEDRRQHAEAIAGKTVLELPVLASRLAAAVREAMPPTRG